MSEDLKVRTLTGFVQVNNNSTLDEVQNKVKICAKHLSTIGKALKEDGYILQTKRITTNHKKDWENNVEAKNIVKYLSNSQVQLERKDTPIDFICIGCPEKLETIPSFILKGLSCSVNLEDTDNPLKTAKQCAKIVKEISEADSLGNFNFCVSSNLKDFCPFYPGSSFKSSADGEEKFGFSVGLESAGLLARAVDVASTSDIQGRFSSFKTVFEASYRTEIAKIVEICQKTVENLNFEYFGIDASLNPSLELTEEKSIGGCLSTLLGWVKGSKSNFGQAGSQFICFTLTELVKKATKNFKTVGYNGLMLAVLEDRGLASLSEELTISKLLQYSGVCGVGLDTIPIPGDFDEESLALLLLDMFALSKKWNKPLSCRFLPAASRKEDELTTFNSPYLINSKVFALDK